MINLYQKYKDLIRKFGFMDSQRFRDSFVTAVNDVYSEFNEKVFEANTLSPISSFDDIIDNRLVKFTDITFDAAPNEAIQNREFWTLEYELERTSETNGFSDITDGGVSVVIANGVISVGAVSAELPSVDIYRISVSSSSEGLTVMVNDSSLITDENSVPLGAVSSHVISGVSGFELLKTRFLTSESVVYCFDLNDEESPLLDDVNGFEAVITGDQWDTRYVEPTTGLDFRYSVPFSAGLQFHLQDGGEWSIEPDQATEVRWYVRGIRSARTAYQQMTTYVGPQGPPQDQ